VRRFLLSILMVGLMLGMGRVCLGQDGSPGELKPVALAAMTSYDETMANLALLGKLSDWSDLPQNVEGLIKLFTRGRGLKGLDKTKPSGIFVQTDGKKYYGYGMVPVANAQELYETFRPHVRDAKEVGDKLYQVQTPHGPSFAKVKDGWVIVSRKQEDLAHAPEDPGKLLAGMTKRYDAGVRIYLGNVPAEHRDKFVAKMKERAEKHIEYCARGGHKHPMHGMMARHMLREFTTAAKDLERVSFGWKLDREARKAIGQLSVTAREGTETQKRLARLGEVKTDFAGFVLADAAMGGHMSVLFPPPGDEQLKSCMAGIEKCFKEKIDKKATSPEEAKQAKSWVDDLLDVVRETLKTGELDGAGSIVLAPKASTLVGGRQVAGADKLEKVFKGMVAACQKKCPECIKDLKWDAEQYQGVRLHTFTAGAPEKDKKREKLERAFGLQAGVVVGFSKDRVYLAAGRDAMKTLKKALDDSKAAADKSVAPVQFTVSLKELTQFVSEVCKDKHKERAGKALAAVNKAASGEDDVVFTVTPKTNGVRYRLEFEEGALRAMGAKRK